MDEGDWRKATKISVGGHQVGGVSDLSNPVYPPGTPPHLAFYLAVDDVDRRLTAAVAAGAEVVVEPFDVADQGRMATLVDPWGAAVSLWQAGEFKGWAYPTDLPGTPARMLLACARPAAAARFYSETLGADQSGIDFVASAMDTGTDGRREKPAWQLAITVADLESVVERAPEHVRSGGAATYPARLVSPEGLVVWLTTGDGR